MSQCRVQNKLMPEICSLTGELHTVPKATKMYQIQFCHLHEPNPQKQSFECSAGSTPVVELSEGILSRIDLLLVGYNALGGSHIIPTRFKLRLHRRSLV